MDSKSSARAKYRAPQRIDVSSRNAHSVPSLDHLSPIPFPGRAEPSKPNSAHDATQQYEEEEEDVIMLAGDLDDMVDETLRPVGRPPRIRANRTRRNMSQVTPTPTKVVRKTHIVHRGAHHPPQGRKTPPPGVFLEDQRAEGSSAGRQKAVEGAAPPGVWSDEVFPPSKSKKTAAPLPSPTDRAVKVPKDMANETKGGSFTAASPAAWAEDRDLISPVSFEENKVDEPSPVGTGITPGEWKSPRAVKPGAAKVGWMEPFKLPKSPPQSLPSKKAPAIKSAIATTVDAEYSDSDHESDATSSGNETDQSDSEEEVVVEEEGRSVAGTEVSPTTEALALRDVSEAVWRGCNMMKIPFHTQRKPQKRFVQQTKKFNWKYAEIYLVWGAAGKPVVRDEHLPLYKYGRKKLKTKRKIQLLGDVQLRRGHRSAVFQEFVRNARRQRKGKPPKADHCLSVEARERSIDLVCPSRRERDEWLQGLNKAIQLAERGPTFAPKVKAAPAKPTTIWGKETSGEDTARSRSVGAAALHKAIEDHNVKTVESLLELGADPNALHPERGICALSAAVVQGEAGVTRALVDHGAALLGAGSQDKPIVVAVEGGALDIVSYLLQVAAYQSIQMSYKMANTALLVTGHGRETDSKAATRTVLHIAAIHGFAEILSKLLDYGADFSALDFQRRTALHVAATCGREAPSNKPYALKRQRQQLEAGTPSGRETPRANIELVGSKEESLGLNVSQEAGGSFLRCVHALLATDTEDLALNLQDVKGRCALHHAALVGSLPIVEALLQAGANPKVLDSKGRSPREVATQYGFSRCAARLREYEQQYKEQLAPPPEVEGKEGVEGDASWKREELEQLQWTARQPEGYEAQQQGYTGGGYYDPNYYNYNYGYPQYDYGQGGYYGSSQGWYGGYYQGYDAGQYSSRGASPHDSASSETPRTSREVRSEGMFAGLEVQTAREGEEQYGYDGYGGYAGGYEGQDGWYYDYNTGGWYAADGTYYPPEGAHGSWWSGTASPMRSPKAPTPGGGRAVLAAAAKSLKEKRQASDSESETESEDSETDEEVEEENDVWRPVKLGDGRLFFFNVTQGRYQWKDPREFVERGTRVFNGSGGISTFAEPEVVDALLISGLIKAPKEQAAGEEAPVEGGTSEMELSEENVSDLSFDDIVTTHNGKGSAKASKTKKPTSSAMRGKPRGPMSAFSADIGQNEEEEEGSTPEPSSSPEAEATPATSFVSRFLASRKAFERSGSSTKEGRGERLRSRSPIDERAKTKKSTSKAAKSQATEKGNEKKVRPGNGKSISDSQGSRAGPRSSPVRAATTEQSPIKAEETSPTAESKATAAASTAAPKEAEPVALTPEEYLAQPQVARWSRMVRMGLALEAVEQKMRQDGTAMEEVTQYLRAAKDFLKDHRFTEFPVFRSSLSGASPTEAGAGDGGGSGGGGGGGSGAAAVGSKEWATQQRKELVAKVSAEVFADGAAQKYLKMRKVGVPVAGVARKMMEDGLDETLVHKFLFAFAGPQDIAALQISKDSLDSSVGVPPEIIEAEQAAEAMGPPAEGPSPATKEAMSRRSNVPLLKLHWDPLPEERLQQSVWSTPRAGVRLAVDDIQELESMFSMKPSKDKEKKVKKAKASGSSKGVVHLYLDGKRANNVSIGLAQFRHLPDGIALAKALLTFNYNDLPASKMEQLFQLMPTPTEVKALKGHKGLREELGPVEQYFMSILDVPRLSSKLTVAHTKAVFDADVADVIGSMQLLLEACEEVMGSKRLKSVLDTILVIGNIMNEGTYKGHARGFTLDSLLKLTTTKARDQKTTLMDYIISRLDKKDDSGVLAFYDDLPSVTSAARVSQPELEVSLAGIHKRIRQIKGELEKERVDLGLTDSKEEEENLAGRKTAAASALNALFQSRGVGGGKKTKQSSEGPGKKRPLPKSDKEVILKTERKNFLTAMERFVDRAGQVLDEAEKLREQLKTQAEALAVFFAEEPAKCPTTRVFETLQKFIDSFKNSVAVYQARQNRGGGFYSTM